VLSMPLCA